MPKFTTSLQSEHYFFSEEALKILLYAMLWYDEWESLTLYAMVLDSIVMVWDSSAML